jgi:hypothetical protein
MQRLYLRSHLFERYRAVNVALIDGVRFVARLKPLQTDRSQSLPHLVHALSPLLFRNLGT